MKLTIPTLCVLALIKAAVFVEACPYLNTEMEVPDLETVEAVKVGGTKQDDRRLRTNSRASFRARIRKFLNRLDFLNLIPNPSPKAPPATKAPVVVAAPTSPAPKAAPPTPVAAAPAPTPVAAAPVTTGLTTAQVVAAARADIAEIIRTNNNANGNIAAKFIRLSFHDCVGGCDGCVDMANLDNTGLNLPIASLAPVVTKYATANTALTRADVWALAGLVAAQNSQGNTTNFDFPLTRIGRPVCANLTNGAPATLAGPDRKLPSAHVTTQQLLDFFATNFGFNDNETVAIMGAHTVGRAIPQNSGFAGQAGWGPDTVRLDNDFYQTLLINGRVQNGLVPELQDNAASAQPAVRQFPNQFLWRVSAVTARGGFMLNADMALAVDMAGFMDATNGAVNCSLQLNGTMPDGVSIRPTCPNAARTLRASVNYARNSAAWVADFRDAFTKMINTGCNATVCTAL